MPLCEVISLSENTKLYLWKISEDFDTLIGKVDLKDASLTRLKCMKSESHQKGFLGVRMLLQYIGYNDNDLYYDEFGKPHLFDGRKEKVEGQMSIHKNQQHISISHSHEFSAVVISDKLIGLDLEQLKQKIVKIAPKFMDVSHLESLSEEEQIKKATVIWGIKECVFKIKNEKGISFPLHIFEEDFSFEDKKAKAQLRFNNKIENFDIVFDFVEDYIYVCAVEKK